MTVIGAGPPREERPKTLADRIESARLLGQIRAELLAKVDAMLPPKRKHAYRSTRDADLGEAFGLVEIKCQIGAVFVYRDPVYTGILWACDRCSLALGQFHFLRNARGLAEELGPKLDELFARASQGDVEAAESIPATVRKWREKDDAERGLHR